MTRSDLTALIISIINTNGANEIEGIEDQGLRIDIIDNVFVKESDTILDITGMPSLVTVGDVGKHLVVSGDSTFGLSSEVPYTNTQIDTAITNAVNSAVADKLSQEFTNAKRTPTNASNVFTVDSSSESKTAYSDYPEALLLSFTVSEGLPTTGSTLVIDSLLSVDLRDQSGDQIENLTEGVYWTIRDETGTYRVQGVGVNAGHTIQDNGVDQTQRLNLNFVGATITDDAGNNATIVTINNISYLQTPFTSKTSVIVTHNIGNAPIVQVRDENRERIIPLSIVDSVDGNSFTVTFTNSTTGDILTTIGAPSVASNYREVTGTDTVLLSDDSINCTSGTFDLTLADATGHTQVFNIKNSNSGVITLLTTGGQTIDGGASGTITLTENVSLTVQSTGANYIII